MYEMKNYLSVKIYETFGNEKTVACGVPQGIPLGPVLFNFYLKNLFPKR